jgi:hypothetical protein
MLSGGTERETEAFFGSIGATLGRLSAAGTAAGRSSSGVSQPFSVSTTHATLPRKMNSIWVSVTLRPRRRRTALTAGMRTRV